MRRPYVALLLAAVALTAATVFLLREGERDRDVDPVTRSNPGEKTPGAARLHGRSPSDAEPGASSTPSVSTDQAEAPIRETAGPRVLLRGSVSVAGDRVVSKLSPPVSIWIGPKRPPTHGVFPFRSVEVRVAAPGPFSVDVTEPCRLMLEAGEHEYVEVYVNHPDTMPQELRVPVPDPAALLDGTASFEPLDLVLQPAGRVSGIVEDVDGSPREGATVLLYRMGSDGPEPHPVYESTSHEGGRFRLRCAQTGRHLVVATYDTLRGDGTTRIGRRPAPASRVVEAAVGRLTEEVRLRLRRSHRIRGAVRHAGRPTGIADLEVRLAVDAPRLQHGKDPAWADRVGLAYADGQVHWAWEDVETEANGTFEILGLSPLAYRLRVTSIPGTLLHREDEAGQTQTVVPPNDQVVFDLRVARLRLRVLDGDAPLRPSRLWVSAIGRPEEFLETLGEDDAVVWDTHFGEADEDGSCTLGLSPGLRYIVTIEHEGYAQYHHDLTAPAAGETLDLVAALRPAVPQPRLVVTLDGPAGDAPQTAGFAFYPADVGSREQTPFVIRSVEAVDDRFVLEDLLPGPQRMHVRPGRAWHEAPSDWAESTIEVDLPREGETTCRVAIHKGGRLQIAATDADGRHLEAACTIHDAKGREVPAWFHAQDTRGTHIASSHGLPAVGACWVEPVLLPGEYRVRLACDGYEPQEHEVRIEAGRPASVNAVLTPRE